MVPDHTSERSRTRRVAGDPGDERLKEVLVLAKTLTEARWTHIALPRRDLDRAIAFCPT